MQRRFEQLMDHHGGRLLQLARLILHSDTEAEDIVQDSLVKLWHHLGELEPGAELPWLITCTRNACLDRLRRERRQVGLLRQVHAEAPGPDAADDPAGDASREERARQLHRAIAVLPEPGRSLLILRDIQDIDVATVARTLDLSKNQVKVYTFRARRALRQKLEEESHEQVA